MVNPKFLQCILPFAGSTDERVINQALGLGNRLYGLVTSKAIAHHHSFGSQQELLDMFITMDDLELILMNGGKLPVGTKSGGLGAMLDKPANSSVVAA